MEIKIYNDLPFRWLFGRQEKTRPLLSLLNTILGYDHLSSCSKFEEITINNPFILGEPLTKNKDSILDIRAKETTTGEWIDLEMEVSYFTHYAARSQYYLASLYREQLFKSKDKNYHELKPSYGIHLLLSNLVDLKEETDWFNHYGMLNYKSHKPLNKHLELYYIELDKLKKALNKRAELAKKKEANDEKAELANKKEALDEKAISLDPLEQWGTFIAKPHIIDAPLDSRLEDNEGIKEVYDMLQTFTRDDHLREQYRIEEEYLRVKRTEAFALEEAQRGWALEKKEKEKEARLREEETRRREEAESLILEERRLREEEQRRREEEQRESKIKFERMVMALKSSGKTESDIDKILNDLQE